MPSLTKEYLIEEYIQKKRSFRDIAAELGTYSNKIRRAAINFGIQPRNKSQAQRTALESGRHKHPTKGQSRPEEVKIKISETLSDTWSNMSDEEYQKRVDNAKRQWENMPQEQKDKLRSAAAEAVRRTTKEGSRLEKFLVNSLRENGFQVQFHRKGLIMNERLEVDLFLPELKTAIEVDGPSHFFPIWGEESLERNMRADAQKSGLLTTNGFVIVRVRHISKHVSNKHKRDLLSQVLGVLSDIQKEFPKEDKRLIEVEV